jgi:endonuclease YncB( thermonuclease family)
VSINQRRRIFRPAKGPLRGTALPSRAVLLAFIGGVLTLGAIVWMALGPSQAPARSPSASFLTADPNQVAVVDGATLRLADRVVRLAGIDPPARGETCHAKDGAGFDCGVAAANALAAMVRGHAVECTLRGHDEGGRPLGTCAAQGAALSQTLVSTGWARAEHGDAVLRTAEAQAQAAGLGMWGSVGR